MSEILAAPNQPVCAVLTDTGKEPNLGKKLGKVSKQCAKMPSLYNTHSLTAP